MKALFIDLFTFVISNLANVVVFVVVVVDVVVVVVVTNMLQLT